MCDATLRKKLLVAERVETKVLRMHSGGSIDIYAPLEDDGISELASRLGGFWQLIISRGLRDLTLNSREEVRFSCEIGGGDYLKVVFLSKYEARSTGIVVPRVSSSVPRDRMAILPTAQTSVNASSIVLRHLGEEEERVVVTITVRFEHLE